MIPSSFVRERERERGGVHRDGEERGTRGKSDRRESGRERGREEEREREGGGERETKRRLKHPPHPPEAASAKNSIQKFKKGKERERERERGETP